MKSFKCLIILFLIVLIVACSADSSQPTNKKFVPGDIFNAQLITGENFVSDHYQGEKIILGFVSVTHQNALPMIQALQKLKKYQAQYNFRIFLVSINFNKKDEVQAFLKKNKIDLPVILEDSDLSLAKKFKVTEEVMMIGLGADHKPEFGIKRYAFPHNAEGESEFLGYVKDQLKIKDYSSTIPHYGIFPEAPDFKATTTDGKSIQLSKLKGKAVLLMFFSPKCPHCQREMAFLKKDIYPEFKDKGLEILAVSVLKLEGDAKAAYDRMKSDWVTIDDSDRAIRSLYSDSYSIPENFFIDRTGRIKYHSNGFSPSTQNLYIMRIKQMLGLPNEPLLSAQKYNGVKTCAVCHEPQYVSWAVTPHAQAWETLEIKGEETNPECVSCHSVGYNDPKGFKPVKNKKTGEEMVFAPNHLTDVQCENCHGLGGPHITKENMMAKDKLKETCLECHTEKFSLHFDFDERIQHVNHSDAAKIMKMSDNEKIALAKKASKNPSDLFDTQKAYVGSQACMSCHDSIYKKWESSSHAHAFESLKTAGKDTDSSCLKCHTVGYGEKTGYTAHIGQKSFEDVGCESCHGPGEKHIVTKKKQDIRGLGDDCPFCVIEQICLSCHDMENSPGFNIHNALKKVKKEHGYK